MGSEDRAKLSPMCPVPGGPVFTFLLKTRNTATVCVFWDLTVHYNFVSLGRRVGLNIYIHREYFKYIEYLVNIYIFKAVNEFLLVRKHALVYDVFRSHVDNK